MRDWIDRQKEKEKGSHELRGMRKPEVSQEERDQ